MERVKTKELVDTVICNAIDFMHETIDESMDDVTNFPEQAVVELGESRPY